MASTQPCAIKSLPLALYHCTSLRTRTKCLSPSTSRSSPPANHPPLGASSRTSSPCTSSTGTTPRTSSCTASPSSQTSSRRSSLRSARVTSRASTEREDCMCSHGRRKGGAYSMQWHYVDRCT
ncbi:hypothetical protein B0H14DRAFT_2480402 [Mycena olivaceomarginata]|nr:hypothetical protein B0H14DRAFT_2480402 [Mycena olivaceomarginata]